MNQVGKLDDEGIVSVVKEKVETEPIKGHHMDLGPGVLVVDLPCGFVDPAGVLHDTMVVKEMTGYEEDILAGKGAVIPRLNQIISNCAERLGTITDKKDLSAAVSKISAPDRLAILIGIRRVSLGDFYDVKVECPNKQCKEISNFSLDLSGIDIIRMDDPMVRDREDTFGNGKRVNWHIMNAEDEEWLSSSRKKRKEDRLTLAMLARIDEIETVNKEDVVKLFKLDRTDKKGYRFALGLLKSLSIRERNEIRGLFDKHEGSVDTEVEFECPECEHEWKGDLEVGQAGFFFPSDS